MDVVRAIVIAAVCAGVAVIELRWSSRGDREVDIAAAMGVAVVGLVGLAVLVNVFQGWVGFVLMFLALTGLIAWGIFYIAVPGWLQRPVRSAFIRRVSKDSSTSD